MSNKVTAQQIEEQVERIKQALYDAWQEPFCGEDLEAMVREAIERLKAQSNRLYELTNKLNQRRKENGDKTKQEAERPITQENDNDQADQAAEKSNQQREEDDDGGKEAAEATTGEIDRSGDR
jgi:ABC-type Zn2+ transport system substrate-binding protein/surface adhesin